MKVFRFSAAKIMMVALFALALPQAGCTLSQCGCYDGQTTRSAGVGAGPVFGRASGSTGRVGIIGEAANRSSDAKDIMLAFAGKYDS